MKEITSLVDEITQGKGYVILPELLSTKQAQEARSLVLKLLQEERQQGKLLIEGNKERLYKLIYKGEIFESMVQHPIVVQIIETILGVDMTLGGFSAHILHPGATNMGVHVDYPYWTMQPPFPSHPIMEIQVIWMVEDFTEHNGAPLFAPGSQKLCSSPDLSQFSKSVEKVTGKAGSVILSHGLCWHDTSVNSTEKSRVSILGNYNPKFIRPLEDSWNNLPQEVLERATPKLKQLLGYNFKSDLLTDIQRLQSQGRK